MYVGINKKKKSRQIKNKDTKMISVIPKLRSSSLSIEYWIQHTTTILVVRLFKKPKLVIRIN